MKLNSLRFDYKQRLTVFDELTILSDYFDDGSFEAGANAIEDLHHFDEPDSCVFGDLGRRE